MRRPVIAVLAAVGLLGGLSAAPPASAPAAQPVLDGADGVLAAYSTRQVRSAYTGPAVRVRRSSDGQQRDIGFTPDGELDRDGLLAFVNDTAGQAASVSLAPAVTGAFGFRRVVPGYTGSVVEIRRSPVPPGQPETATFGLTAGGVVDDAAIQAFIGAGTGYVRTWFDQSGSGRDAVQTEPSQQPTYSATAIGGQPGVVFDGSDDWLPFARTASVRTANLVAQWAGITGDLRIIFGVDANSPELASSDGPFHGATAASGELFGSPWVSNRVRDGANYINGTRTTGLLARYTAPTVHVFCPAGDVEITRLGRDRSYLGSRQFWGSMGEVVLSSNVLSAAARARLEGEQGAHFGITVTSEADAPGTGTVDAPDAYVTRWYDQSGNGRDLVPSSVATQPRIVRDGSLLTLGGHPTVRLDTTDDLEAPDALGGTTAEMDAIITSRADLAFTTSSLAVRFSADADPQVGASLPAADGTASWDVAGTSGANRVQAAGPAVGSATVATLSNSVADDRQSLRLNGWTIAADDTAHSAATTRTRLGSSVRESVSELLVLRALSRDDRLAIEENAMRAFSITPTQALSVLSGPAEGSTTNLDSSTFTFAATGAGAGGTGASCRVDGGAFTPCGSPHTVSGLSAGSHTLEIRPYGGILDDPGPAISRSWTVQGTEITDAPAASSRSDVATFAFSTPAGMDAQCRVDGQEWATCHSPIRVDGLSDGSHRFSVRGVSGAQTGPATERTWSVDTTVSTRLTESPSSLWSSSSATFAFAGGHASDTFACRLDDGTWERCASPHTVGGLADGPHTFQVRAVSSAGRADDRPPVASFVVDTVAPDTSISGQPLRPTFDPGVKVRVASPERGVRYQCRAGSEAWTSCTTRWKVTLDPGKTRLQARAVDQAGNADPRPATVRVAVRRIESPTLDPSEGRRKRDSGSAGDPTRCDISRPPGAKKMRFRWLRDGRRVEGAHAQDLRSTRLLDGGVVRCQATITFASGATTVVRSAPKLLLGTRWLGGVRFASSARAYHGLPRLRFTTNAPGRILVRVWCRTTDRRCVPPGGRVDVDAARPAARAAFVPVGLTKYRRLVTRAERGANALNLGRVLPRGLPRGSYKITVRLAERTSGGRHRTTTPMDVEFTVR